MADLNVALILRLVDRATGPARTALKALDQAGAGLKASGAAQMATARDQIAATKQHSTALWGEAAALGATGFAMSKSIQPAIEFEKKMAEVGKVVNFGAADGIQRLGQDIQNLVTSGGLPMAAGGIADIVAAAAQANLIDAALPDEEKRRQLVAFGEAAAKMGVAFDIGAADAGKAMATWRTQLGLDQQQALLLGDAVNYLSNNMNASAADVTNVIGRVGALAKVAGLSNDQVAALSASFVSAAPAPDIAATAMKNFIGTLVSGEAMTKRQSAVMDQLGFDATKLAKRMQTDARGAIMDVMQALAKLPAAERTSTLTQLFGEESVGAIAPLLQNLPELKRSFELVGNEANYAGAMTQEYEGVAATTAARLQVLRNYIEQLTVSMGMPLLGAIKDLIAVAGPLLTAISAWINAHPDIVRAVAATVVGLFALRVGLLGARFALQPLIMSWWGFRWVVGAASWALGAVVGLLPALGRMLMLLLNPMALVRLALGALRIALITSGVGAMLVAVAMAGLWIWQNWAGLGTFFDALWTSFRDALGPASPMLDAVLAKVQALWHWVIALTGPLDTSGERWRGWGTAVGAAIGTAVRAVMDWTAAHPQLAFWTGKLLAGLIALKLVMTPVSASFRLLTAMASGLGTAVGILLNGILVTSRIAILVSRWGFGALTTSVATLVRVLLVAGRFAIGLFAQGLALMGRAALVVGRTALVWLAQGIGLVGRALLIAGRFAMANPIILVLTAIAGLAYVIYRNWDGFVAYFSEKIARVRAAFDQGLLHGVLTLLSEFNPFRMIMEGATNLVEYLFGIDLTAVHDAIARAFDIDLFEAGVSMIKSLAAGIWSLLTSMVSEIQAKLAGIVPDWMRDAWNGTGGGIASADGSRRPGLGHTSSGPIQYAQKPSAIPGRATGGPVRAGLVYRWMEEGQELFQPNVSGRVVSNREMRNMTTARSGRPNVTIGDIIVHAAQGQSATDIARAVRDELLRTLSSADDGADLHDGGTYV